MDSMVISFGGSGLVEAMHRDEFNLSFLGKRTIKRASEIIFNDDTSRWDIFIDDGSGEFSVTSASLTGFRGYDDARRYEVSWLDNCRLQGVDPASDDGLYEIAAAVLLHIPLETPSI